MAAGRESFGWFTVAGGLAFRAGLLASPAESGATAANDKVRSRVRSFIALDVADQPPMLVPLFTELFFLSGEKMDSFFGAGGGGRSAVFAGAGVVRRGGV